MGVEIDNSYGLADVQNKLLDGLILLDRICRENQICYTLHGGTLLGAVRNKKFIPWDDDADVSMTRAEYEKLKRTIGSVVEKKAVLTENVLWFSRFVYSPEDNPAFIDIFIYDYISEKKAQAFLKITVLRFLQGMIKPKENLDFQGRSLAYRIAIMLCHLAGKMFSDRRKLNWYHRVEQNWFTGKRQYIHRSNDRFYGLPYIFDTGFMAEYMDIQFEGHTFMANKRYREFLQRNYGDDYMTPPPENERHPEHEQVREQVARTVIEK